jgi:hypothetical protein
VVIRRESWDLLIVSLKIRSGGISGLEVPFSINDSAFFGSRFWSKNDESEWEG